MAERSLFGELLANESDIAHGGSVAAVSDGGLEVGGGKTGVSVHRCSVAC